MATFTVSVVYEMRQFCFLRYVCFQFRKDLAQRNLRLYGPQCERSSLQVFANNKGADHPAHTRSLISPFVIRYNYWKVFYLDLLRAKSL